MITRTCKPHIVIVAMGGDFWLGGRQYSINLLEALTRFRGEIGDYDVSVLVHDRAELQHYEHLRPQLSVCASRGDLQAQSTITNRIAWRLGRRLRGHVNPPLEEALIGIGATFAYPASLARVPSADWIADFQYDHFPDKMSAKEIEARTHQFSYTVRHAMRIVLSSAHAEADCLRLFPQTAGRTEILRFRVFAKPSWLEGDPQAAVARYHLPARFALISNWLLPTKNHLLVLDALAAIPAPERERMHVVCTGDIYDYRNPGYYNAFLNRIHTLGLQRNVSVLGVIPKDDQIQLLRAASAYLQPSLFEGWNTGVEEAHLLGKPILLSDIPVHREQTPARATYFDPHDASPLARALRAHFAADAAPRSATEERAAVKAYESLQREFARTFLAIAAPAARPAESAARQLVAAGSAAP